MRQFQRASTEVIAGWGTKNAVWGTQEALSLLVTLRYFVKDLTDREVLIARKRSAMVQATRQQLTMFAYGSGDGQGDGCARRQVGELLMRLQADGWYR